MSVPDRSASLTPVGCGTCKQSLPAVHCGREDCILVEPTRCPARSDKGAHFPHLPRFPVGLVNQMNSYEYECAYCGKGCLRDGSERP